MVLVYDASFNGVDDLMNSEAKQRELERAEIEKKQQQAVSAAANTNSSSSSNSINNNIQQRLQNFYMKYDPSKLPNVPAILEKYKNNEEKLMQNLVGKYGPEPTSTQQEILQKQNQNSHFPMLFARSGKFEVQVPKICASTLFILQ